MLSGWFTTPARLVLRSVGDNTGKMLMHGVQTARQVLEAAGARTIRENPQIGLFAHLMGSCRVGVDPKHSVVARWNRVHGISNLFVVDGSIIYNEWSGQPHIKRLVPWLFVPQKVFGRHVSSGLGAYFVLTSKPAALGRGWKNVAPKAPGKPDADWPPLTA